MTAIRFRSRRGAATIEMALSLGMLMFLTIGSIEVCNLIYFKQALAQTAYDGGMRALRPGVDQAAVEQQIQQLLDARMISNATITVVGDGKPFDQVTRGDTFFVAVQANPAGNVSVVPWIIRPADIRAEVVGRKQ